MAVSNNRHIHSHADGGIARISATKAGTRISETSRVARYVAIPASDPVHHAALFAFTCSVRFIGRKRFNALLWRANGNIIPSVPKLDENQKALRQVESATGSGRVRGESLLKSADLKRHLREAKKRVRK
jgi:hypothetical protein